MKNQLVWSSNIKENAAFFQMKGNFEEKPQYFITKMKGDEKLTIKPTFDNRVLFFYTIEEAQKWCQNDFDAKIKL